MLYLSWDYSLYLKGLSLIKKLWIYMESLINELFVNMNIYS